jgi:transposase
MPKHRAFTPDYKAQLVLEVISGAKTAAEVCREHQIKPDLFSKWKSQFLSNAAKVFQGAELVDPAQARIVELERLVGQLTLELEVSKKASRLLTSMTRKNAS